MSNNFQFRLHPNKLTVLRPDEKNVVEVTESLFEILHAAFNFLLLSSYSSSLLAGLLRTLAWM